MKISCLLLFPKRYYKQHEMVCLCPFTEARWASVLWLGVLNLWKDIHCSKRNAQQMPKRRVISVLLFVSSGNVADQLRHCWYGCNSSSRFCSQGEICEWSSACSSQFFILKLKFTSVISTSGKKYWNLHACVTDQDGKAAVLGKSARQSSSALWRPILSSRWNWYFTLCALSGSLREGLFSKVQGLFLSIYLDIAVVWYIRTLALLK